MTVLPIIIAPKSGESLTSWLDRSRHYYGMNDIWSFVRAAPVSYGGKWVGDIDVKCPSELFKCLAAAFSIQKGELEALRTSLKYRLDPGLRKAVCLQCWAADMLEGRAFYRRDLWSFPLALVCEHHMMPLVDCPSLPRSEAEFMTLYQPCLDRQAASELALRNHRDTCEILRVTMVPRGGEVCPEHLRYLEEFASILHWELRDATRPIGTALRLRLYDFKRRGEFHWRDFFGDPYWEGGKAPLYRHGTVRLGRVPGVGYRRQLIFATLDALKAIKHQDHHYLGLIGRRAEKEFVRLLRLAPPSVVQDLMLVAETF